VGVHSAARSTVTVTIIMIFGKAILTVTMELPKRSARALPCGPGALTSSTKARENDPQPEADSGSDRGPVSEKPASDAQSFALFFATAPRPIIFDGPVTPRSNYKPRNFSCTGAPQWDSMHSKLLCVPCTNHGTNFKLHCPFLQRCVSPASSGKTVT
jgi:hypothetical protein